MPPFSGGLLTTYRWRRRGEMFLSIYAEQQALPIRPRRTADKSRDLSWLGTHGGRANACSKRASKMRRSNGRGLRVMRL